MEPNTAELATLILSFNILTGHNDLNSQSKLVEYKYKLHAYVFIAVHTIAAVKVKEDYDGIAEGNSDCFETINEAICNPHKTINGVDHDLEFFLYCNYKVSNKIHSKHYIAMWKLSMIFLLI